jgi:radical SAM protein with 4Fe4S-binding SPASM domain
MNRDTLKKIKYMYSFLMKRPIHINMQILYDCNFRCKICDFWKSPYTQYPHLSLAQVKTIAHKLKSLGPQVINIGGGEPFLHKEIFPIIETLSKDNFTSMICNGWFVTPDTAKSLFRAGIYEISISIDYDTPEKHDEQRGHKNAFDRAVNGLRVLKENRLYPHQRVHMISVVMDDNLDEIESLIKLAKDIGVTYLVSLYSDNRGKKDSLLTSKDVSSRLLDLKKKYPEFVSLRGYLEKFSSAISHGGITPCYAGKNLFNIDSQGEVTQCIDRLNDTAGNILTEDIAVIMNNLMKRWQNNDCHGCWTSCRGSIESMMYGDNKLNNMADYYSMTRSLP